MAEQEVHDRFQLGQLIRIKGHMLDIATRTKKPDMDTKLTERAELEQYLDEWEKNGWPKEDFIIWARQRLNKFNGWLKDQKPIINRNMERKLPFMDFDDILFRRRSIRYWKKKVVDRDTISEIIRAGLYAPSAFNRMPWRFFVAETAIKDIPEGDASNPGMFQTAPVRIFVGVDERLFFEKFSGPLDTGFAMQNMVLKAHALGLGSCIIYQGEYIDPKLLEKYYHIPAYCTVYCALLLGYPDEDPETPARMEVEEVTEFLGIIPNPDF